MFEMFRVEIFGVENEMDKCPGLKKVPFIRGVEKFRVEKS